MNLLKSLMLLISLVLSAALLFGCDDSGDDSDGNAGTSGSGIGGSGPDDGSGASTASGTGGPTAGNGGPTAGSGGTNDQVGELPECLPQDPPLADPYCHNPRCPIQLAGADPANQPKGNCCNTVDVKLMEDAMSAGETYDLEFAQMVSLGTNNPNLFAPIIEDATRTRQEVGGDVALYRIKGVPRFADIEKDADGNPIPVELTIETGPGKLNCDGTYSFYGPNAAPPPVAAEGIPNDPSRWTTRETTLNYYGPEGEYLFQSSSESDRIRAEAGLRWTPRWDKDGLNLEFGYRFGSLKWKTELMDDHRSCIGSIDKDGAWQRAGTTWTFTLVEEGEMMPIPSIGNQSLCGLFAMGAMGGNCSDSPQSDWTIKPTVYCNDDSYCWIGDPADDTYAQFWQEFYEGEDGCDASGAGEHPCCDPAGLDSTLPACNAYPSVSTFVVAAVNITDERVDDPAEAHSWMENCP